MSNIAFTGCCHTNQSNLIDFSASYELAENSLVAGDLKIFKVDGPFRVLFESFQGSSVPEQGSGTVVFNCGDGDKFVGFVFSCEINLTNHGTTITLTQAFPGDVCSTEPAPIPEP